MEDYRLEQTGPEVQSILNGAAMDANLQAEVERATDAEGTLQGNIDSEERARQDADGLLQQGISDEENRAKRAEEANAGEIEGIKALIPSTATSANKLADTNYVNSSIQTATAEYRGYYNVVTDLHLAIDATHAQIETMLGTVIAEADKNDYCYVMIPTNASTPTEIAKIERYKMTSEGWKFEYDVNNSTFTAEEWAAIKSGITSGLVGKLNALPTNADLLLLLAGKQDVLTFDSVPVPESNNPVKSGGVYSAIDDEKTARLNSDTAIHTELDGLQAKVPATASSDNKLVDQNQMNSSISTATATFRGDWNVVSDLHLAVDATRAQIAALLPTVIATADNNDYCYVEIPTSAETPAQIERVERYKFNGTAWAYEYTLNNSGFTAAQWAAINSMITSGLVAKLSALPTNADLLAMFATKQDVLTFDTTPTQNSTNPVTSGGVFAADKALSDAIEAILLLIPSAASSLNKLVDTSLMNSSISTATATFRGTYNLVSDLGLGIDATEGEIAAALLANISTADNNDYAFVQIPTSAETPTQIARTDRYKFNGTAWAFEYTLNTSGFTAAQWAAINSTITSALVAKLNDLPTAAELQEALGILTSGITAINQKIPSTASQANKLVDASTMESYIAQVINILDASFNVTSTDGHITLHITQVDGVITSVQVQSTDIASAANLALKASQADLTALASRVTTAEGNISSLTGRMGTAETNIANLQQLYNNLQQSKPVPVTALPSTGQQQGVIYRLAGTTSYSDYMWNGSSWVLMATYNNAIDPRPKKASQNLVTSGGVFDNIGALDVSELNATENPHTLAQYTDLSSALAAIPTDYQKGGMSIKYVQSSDNKYVQYRLLADVWSADTGDWAIADEGIYVDNPEFIYVKIDAENKILWAIKTDGSIYFGAGVPQQVIDYIEKKLADLSLDEYEDIVAFLDDLEKGDKTLQTLLDEKVDKEEGKSLIPTQYIQETENPAFVDACTDNEDKLIEATTKEGVKIFFGDVDVKRDLTTEKIYSNKIYLGEDELSPASTVDVNTIISDPEGRLEIKTDEKQKIISYRDEKGILHENVGIETNELKLSQVGLDLLSKDLKVNWSDYISNDGENPLHLSTPKCARINLLTDFDLTKLSKKGYSVNSKAGINYDIPIEIEFWDMQGNYFKKKAFIGGQGDSTMAFDKKNIAIDLFDSEWGGDAFSIKFGDWVAQDSYHLKAYDYEPFVGVGAWSYKLFDQMASIYDPESDRIWKKALWDTTANIPTQASGSDLEESSEYNDTGAKCFPDGFPVIIYQNDAFWGVFSMQMKKHRDNYHMSSSKPNHVFLDGKIGEGTLDANGSPNAIRWDLWEIRNPKNLVYAPFAEYGSETPYKEGDSVTDSSRSRIYRSLQDGNTGNPLSFPYWKDCGDYTYKYDADITQAEIAGNHDGSSSYNNWTAGTYNVGDLRKHTIDGKSHIFMNVVAGNDKEPAIVYNAQKDEWYNTDKSPDFKNKSKCGWLNITNTVKVKENIFAFTTIMTKIDAKETAYLANPTAENLAAMKAEFETYFDVQNLIDYIIVTDVIRDDDAFWKNWLWTTYDGVKWWCNLYDCNISFGYGGAGTGGYYRSPAPYMWNGEQCHLCTYKSLMPDGHSDFMLRYIIDYYADELNQTWIELREGKIIDENNIYNIAKNWIDAVGLDAYALENAKWEDSKHIDNMVRIKKWIYQSVIGLDPLYGFFDDLYADFTIYRSTERDYTIRCIDMKVSHVLSRQYSYIQGYVTRHESVVDGETVSTYSITRGAETDEDITKTYTTVKEAIIAASSQPVDVPSSTLSYIMARCENIEYHRK